MTKSCPLEISLKIENLKYTCTIPFKKNTSKEFKLQCSKQGKESQRKTYYTDIKIIFPFHKDQLGKLHYISIHKNINKYLISFIAKR